MAGAAIINIIGAISGALGIIQFGQDNFGSGEDKGGSVVRIQVGLDSDRGLNNAGGDLPDIRLFNEVGEFLGAKYVRSWPHRRRDGLFGSTCQTKGGAASHLRSLHGQ